MLQRLPFELQERIVSLLDVHSVSALTETDAFNHLFTLITNFTDTPPGFFLHRNLRRVGLEEYVKGDRQGLVTLVELKVTDRHSLDVDAFYNKLSLSTNFIVGLKFHYEKECGLMFGPIGRELKLYEDSYTLSKLVAKMPQKTHILLTGQVAFDIQVPNNPDYTRLTVENAAMLTLVHYNKGKPLTLLDVDELCLKDPTDLDPLSGLDLLCGSSAPALVVDSRNDAFPFQITTRRTIHSKRMFLSNVLRLENIEFLGASMRLEMVGSVLQETPSLKAVQAPNTTRLALLVDTEDFEVEDIDFPSLKDLQIATSAEARNFLHLNFAHHFDLHKLTHLEILGAVISSKFFLDHRNGFDSLQELGFLVEDHHMRQLQTGEGYGAFPLLKKLSLLVVFGLDCKGKSWVPLMAAPELTSFAMEFHYSPGNPTYSTKDLFNTLQTFGNLVKLDLTFMGEHLTDVTEPLQTLCDRLRCLRLAGVEVDFLSDRDVKFSKLENLCLCGASPEISEYAVTIDFDAPHLTNLSIYSWKDVEILEVRGFAELRELRVRDMALEFIQLDDLPSLKRLSSACTLHRISSTGLPSLERLIYIPQDHLDAEQTLDIEDLNDHIHVTAASLHDYSLLIDRLDTHWPMDL